MIDDANDGLTTIFNEIMGSDFRTFADSILEIKHAWVVLAWKYITKYSSNLARALMLRLNAHRLSIIV